MKKISVFTLLLTLVAGGVFAQTLYNSGNSWKNKGHWRIEGTGDKANAVPTSSNDVNIVVNMNVGGKLLECTINVGLQCILSGNQVIELVTIYCFLLWGTAYW